jgi:hypothetical protein
MLLADPEELSSTIEQVGHHFEENGFQIRPLYIITPDKEVDPEEDPGSIASIYKHLISTLPSHGLNEGEMKSKIHAIHEIALDVGLANIGVLRPARSSETSSLENLRKFIDIDPLIELSEAAKFVLGKWGEVPEIEMPQRAVVGKRRRVRVDQSQSTQVMHTMSQGDIRESRTGLMSSQAMDAYAAMPMSQPERGKHGVRVVRRKTRRSGF